MKEPTARRVVATILFIIALLAQANLSGAQQASSTAQQQKVDRLLELLADKDIQTWIDSQKAAATTSKSSTPTINALSFSSALARIHSHVSQLLLALPQLPHELALAGSKVLADLGSRGAGEIALLFAAFTALGFLAQWVFWRVSEPWRAFIAASASGDVRNRLLALVSRLAWSACYLLAFAIGSIISFLAFDWPILVREIVVGFLFAVVLIRLVHVLLQILLAPRSEAREFRIIPIDDNAAAFWSRHLAYVAGWFILGWTTVKLFVMLGIPQPSYQIIAYALGLVLLGLGLWATWMRPRQPSAGQHRLGDRTFTWALTTYFVLLWVFWVAGAMKLFWLAAVSLALPWAVVYSRRAIRHILRGRDINETSAILSGVIERVVLFLLVLCAVFWLARSWDIDIAQITAGDTFVVRAARGVLAAVVIALVANLAWYIARTLIDRKLADSEDPAAPDSEERQRRARIKTLLPILRNVLLIVLSVVTVLMVLSSLGIQIGPLVAGAGIVGVAVGFGAQTVVKDIISGMFYLLDDAFRTGEYIESSNYRGTVESFSLRSIKLRHHRGAIYIVPFSELGAVRNLSRDWVIEKITLTITYDSDVDKARKIIKKIGQTLAEDPEFKASIIEPLKMQGIDEFGDSGMVVRMKLKTRPGEQFTIKRRALMMIKAAFDENDIKLAVPTVQVSGGSPEAAGAAQHLIAKQQAAALQATSADQG